MLTAYSLDWICNWYGSQLVANNVVYDDSAEFQATELAEYTVDGTSYGQFKTVGNVSSSGALYAICSSSVLTVYQFNFLRVYEAGHEVPYYQPVVALQAFTQILKGEQLTST